MPGCFGSFIFGVSLALWLLPLVKDQRRGTRERVLMFTGLGVTIGLNVLMLVLFVASAEPTKHWYYS